MELHHMEAGEGRAGQADGLRPAEMSPEAAAGAVPEGMCSDGVCRRDAPEKGLPAIGRLRRRQDFLAANRGARVVTPAFILLVHGRTDGDAGMRAGFTVSKRIGNAVTRNRAKRRLREGVRATLGQYGTPGADHVFIARPQEKERPFLLLLADMERALQESRERPARGPRGPRAPRKAQADKTPANKTPANKTPANKTPGSVS